MPPDDNKPLSGTVQRPANENLVNGLSRVNQHNYMRLKESMFEVAKERPDLDTRVYTEYMQDYLNAATKREAEVKKILAAAKADGYTPNRSELERETAKEHREFMKGFVHNKLPKYGAEGKEAWSALHKKMQGPSIFSAAASQIYDKNKGGMQWGGLVGLLVGGFMATQLGAGLFNGLMPALMTIGAAFLGAWLGNKAVDGVSNLVTTHSETPENTPARAPEQTQKPEQQQEKPQGPLTPEVKEQARDALQNPPTGDKPPVGVPPKVPGKGNAPTL